MVRETRLSPDNFIQPLFVCPGRGVSNPIQSMPGVAQLSADMAAREAKEIAGAGVPGVILFGIPEHKDAIGSQAWDDSGCVQRAIGEIKEHVPGLVVITDVCMCEYTDHGHCGAIKDGDVDNDATLELLRREALSHARAGADIVAPSDMMDGRVGAIRAALDENGFSRDGNHGLLGQVCLRILWTVPRGGGVGAQVRRSPLLPDGSGQRRRGIREVALDLEEGADIVMVKPALPYLDLIYRVKQEFKCPVAAYNVSGEYSMIRAAGINGWLDEARAAMEVLVAIKRAGADLILTYFAKQAARELS